VNSLSAGTVIIIDIRAATTVPSHQTRRSPEVVIKPICDACEGKKHAIAAAALVAFRAALQGGAERDCARQGVAGGALNNDGKPI
jgi:hypothetical protein